MSDAVRVVALVRAGWGAVLLCAPVSVLRACGYRSPGGAASVARVLGARHVLQAAVTLRAAATWTAAGSEAVVGAGAAVDGLHALTGVALAAGSPRWRRVAAADAGVAAAFATAGWLAARKRHGAGHPGSATGPARRR
jgi:hypothetical protein